MSHLIDGKEYEYEINGKGYNYVDYHKESI